MSHPRIPCPFSPSRTFVDERRLRTHVNKKHPDASAATNDENDTIGSFKAKLSQAKSNIKVLRRIPKAARFLVADKLCGVIKGCFEKNSLDEWSQLLLFSYIVLGTDGEKKTSLVTKIKKNISSFQLSDHVQKRSSPLTISKRVQVKVDDYDIKGAIRILSSSETMAPHDDQTIRLLQEKHPPSSPDLQFPEPPNNVNPLSVQEKDVQSAISSFPSGSAGGMDGFRPQFLKDIISVSAGEAGKRVLKALSQLCNFLLSGRVNEQVCPFLFGASLCALVKKDGGIRPIAVGSVFRRLTAKLACRHVQSGLSDYFMPNQLGVGVKRGCEILIHAVRHYVTSPENSRKVLLKIDYANAFNSISRDIMMKQVIDKVPIVYPFLEQCYRTPSYLFYGNNVILSESGCQQGDPCGPLLFSLTVHPMIEALDTELNSWYLDDATLADTPARVLDNFKKLKVLANEMGLRINANKCELYVGDDVPNSASLIEQFKKESPGIITVTKSDLSLLGSPVFEEGFTTFVTSKVDKLKLLIERLGDLNAHVSYLLLKNCLLIPKLTYLLRTSPFWKFDNVTSMIDRMLRDSLEQILNTSLNEQQWNQATLPINFGGLGIRKVSDLALPAFLSSAFGVTISVSQLLYSTDQEIDHHLLEEAMDVWRLLNGETLPPTDLKVQKEWDIINIKRIIAQNITLTTPTESARFLALQQVESGAWLKALPSTNLGTFMDNPSFRTCVALRLGCKIYKSHSCECGSIVNEDGLHGLVCKKSKGRFPRHSELNDIVHRSLSSIHVPSTLEPVGLCRDDGKRPDGMTLVHWSHGRSLVWDCTCVDTLAATYLPKTSLQAGAAAEEANKKKIGKYSFITAQNYYFQALAFETLGPFSADTKKFVNKLGQSLVEVTGDKNARAYLFQRISVAIQRGNAASVLGTLPSVFPLEELFYI